MAPGRPALGWPALRRLESPRSLNANLLPAYGDNFAFDAEDRYASARNCSSTRLKRTGRSAIGTCPVWSKTSRRWFFRRCA
jgi:hypothetical protein